LLYLVSSGCGCCLRTDHAGCEPIKAGGVWIQMHMELLQNSSMQNLRASTFLAVQSFHSSSIALTDTVNQTPRKGKLEACSEGRPSFWREIVQRTASSGKFYIRLTRGSIMRSRNDQGVKSRVNRLESFTESSAIPTCNFGREISMGKRA
jgi:hypothetical protein